MDIHQINESSEFCQIKHKIYQVVNDVLTPVSLIDDNLSSLSETGVKTEIAWMHG